MAARAGLSLPPRGAAIAAIASLCAIAMLVRASGAAGSPLRECYSERSDFFSPLAGRWSEPEGVRPRPYALLGCPLMTSQFSCGYLGNAVRAAVLQRTRFVPSECVLRDPADPAHVRRFLQRNAGRTIVFAGDSMTGQHFSAFHCNLMAAAEPLRTDIEWEDRVWNPDGPVCGPERCAITEGPHASLNRATIVYEHNVTFHFHRDLKPLTQIQTPFAFFGLRPTDAIIANAGLWYNPTYKADQAERYVADIGEMLHYVRDNSAILPVVIFRESTAQHFAKGDGGLYPPGISPTDRVCAGRPLEQMRDARNALVRDAVEEAGLAVLRVWEHSAQMSNGTMWDQNKPDCTHFCAPGVPDSWADLTFTMLLHI